MRAFRLIAQQIMLAIRRGTQRNWEIDTLSNMRLLQTSTVGITSIGFCISHDMSKLFGHDPNDLTETTYQRSMSPAGDISSLTLLPGTFVYGNGKSPNGCFITSDGTKFAVSTNADFRVYSLPTPNSFTGASNLYIDTAATFRGKLAVWFSEDGKTLLIGSNLSGTLTQYTLGTAFDTRTVTSTVTKALPNANSIFGIVANSDLSQIIISDSGNGGLMLYDLPTPGDITSITTRRSVKVVGGGGGIAIDRINGKYLFYWNAYGSPDTLYKYDLFPPTMIVEVVIPESDPTNKVYIPLINPATDDIVADYGLTLAYDMKVDWGDGSPLSTITAYENSSGSNASHVYASPGTYTVTISGLCEGLEYNDLWAYRVKKVKRFDDLGFKILNYVFEDLNEFTTNQSMESLVFVEGLISFYNPSTCTVLDLSSWNNMPNLKYCSYMLYDDGTSDIHTINLNNFDISSVEMFRGLDSLIYGKLSKLKGFYANNLVLNATDGEDCSGLFAVWEPTDETDVIVEVKNLQYNTTLMTTPVYGTPVSISSGHSITVDYSGFNSTTLTDTSFDIFGLNGGYMIGSVNLIIDNAYAPNTVNEFGDAFLYVFGPNSNSTLSMKNVNSNCLGISMDLSNGSLDCTGTSFASITRGEELDYLLLSTSSYDHLLEVMSATILAPDVPGKFLKMGTENGSKAGNTYSATGAPFRAQIAALGWTISDGGLI